MPWLLGNYAALESEEFDTLGIWIDSLEVGGIIISIGPPLEIAAKLNALQRRSHLPLLIAADLEWGSGMRLRGGTTFPVPMAIGATAREDDAYQLGRVTAIEARAVGIHMTFSPVADLNNNPSNPIINTRSFGEDPHEAARLIRAYIHGASDYGLFTTAKHFPGHGDTDVDSHISLPVVRGCWNRLDTLELVPFREAIAAGVTAVMTAHVALTCIDGATPPPATLSSSVMQGILRDSLGFQGLVVTDALAMGAVVGRYGAGESAVQAFLAGSDLLLMPASLDAAAMAMVQAVESGRIPLERLDRSVRRVLELKVAAGLFRRRTVPLEDVTSVVARRDFVRIADDIAARSVTLVQRGNFDTFRANRGRTAMVVYADEGNLTPAGTFARDLAQLGDTARVFRLYPQSGPLSYDSARTVIRREPRVIFALNVRVISGRGHVDMPDSLARLIQQTAGTKPTALVSFGSPYLLSQLPTFRGAFLVAWSDATSAERGAARALAGGAPITGRLPIALNGTYARGHGVRIPPSFIGETNGQREISPAFDTVRTYLQRRVEDGAFPGGVLFVGSRGRLVYHTAVGRYGVDDPRPVSDTTVYDLASLTKVVGLTTAAMLLAQDGRLDLDRPVSEYVPRFAQHGKRAVTVRQLLTHSSGLPAWRPFYELTATPAEAIDSILAAGLEAAPGQRYVYSDLGAITLTEVIKAITGQPFERFLEDRVFAPLALTRTRFLPPVSWATFVAPTERDPWRGRMLRGEVHDENAARLGGVSGHAGLFSTGPDLIRFAFWLLDAYHDRLPANAPLRLRSDVVREFVTRQPGPDGSTRALGWDTPSATGSSAGSKMARTSFGHTGFTGTSIWIDPEQETVIILLTNRVHPTRDNRAILEVRGRVADLVVDALEASQVSQSGRR